MKQLLSRASPRVARTNVATREIDFLPLVSFHSPDNVVSSQGYSPLFRRYLYFLEQAPVTKLSGRLCDVLGFCRRPLKRAASDCRDDDGARLMRITRDSHRYVDNVHVLRCI